MMMKRSFQILCASLPLSSLLFLSACDLSVILGNQQGTGGGPADPGSTSGFMSGVGGAPVSGVGGAGGASMSGVGGAPGTSGAFMTTTSSGAPMTTTSSS